MPTGRFMRSHCLLGLHCPEVNVDDNDCDNQDEDADDDNDHYDCDDQDHHDHGHNDEDDNYHALVHMPRGRFMRSHYILSFHSPDNDDNSHNNYNNDDGQSI